MPISPEESAANINDLISKHIEDITYKLANAIDATLLNHDFIKNPVLSTRLDWFMLGAFGRSSLISEKAVNQICDGVIKLYKDKGWFIEYIDRSDDCGFNNSYREYYFSTKPMKLKGWLFQKFFKRYVVA